ncbi:expressed unknown protein [Seminavis robusta]|uniref:Uncharacterized protein n=1 Tax=Seminavis robusta TaxID=568900 RepID=A0A9N8D7L1_9STRA|nr:expressed unknown protein [Seminavis robusta]|eukprot:Sro27_g018250.1 n/a (171) ;mRNA; f:102166-102678
MPQMFSFQLLLVVLATTVLSVAAEAPVYQPASGFYSCPKVGMVCNVEGCGFGDSDSCSTIANGFDVHLVGEIAVYTSNTDGADLSITGGDDTRITCDDDCTCQFVTAGVGCAIATASDASTGTGIVNMNGEEYKDVEINAAVTEDTTDSAATTTTLMAGTLLSFLVVAAL